MEKPPGCRISAYEYTYYVDLITRTHLITFGGGPHYDRIHRFGKTEAAGTDRGKYSVLLKNWTLV